MAFVVGNSSINTLLCFAHTSAKRGRGVCRSNDGNTGVSILPLSSRWLAVLCSHKPQPTGTSFNLATNHGQAQGRSQCQLYCPLGRKSVIVQKKSFEEFFGSFVPDSFQCRFANPLSLALKSEKPLFPLGFQPVLTRYWYVNILQRPSSLILGAALQYSGGRQLNFDTSKAGNVRLMKREPLRGPKSPN